MEGLTDAFKASEFKEIVKPGAVKLGGFYGVATRYVNHDKGMEVVGYCMQSGGYGMIVGSGNNFNLANKTIDEMTQSIAEKYFEVTEKQSQKIK
jgi:hypothetical protein